VQYSKVISSNVIKLLIVALAIHVKKRRTDKRINPIDVPIDGAKTPTPPQSYSLLINNQHLDT
jgi:hypothetical protein